MYPVREIIVDPFRLQDTNLDIHPNSDSVFPIFGKPNALGCYSLNSDRMIEYDAMQLRYCKLPCVKSGQELSIDLNEGYSARRTKSWTAHSEGMEHILRYIMRNHATFFKSPLGNQGRVVNAEYVSYREVISLLMNTPYETSESWCIHVTLFKGTFYMWRPDTIQGRREREQQTDESAKVSSWHYKFKQCILSESPLLEPKTNQAVDECAAFVCVFRTKINGMKLIYAADMDGILSDHFIADEPKCNELKFVDLKTMQSGLKGSELEAFNRHKTRRWWIHSFLVGIQDIFVGHRTQSGVLKAIKHMHTKELTKISTTWSGSACANFLCSFLKNLTVIMSNVDCPYTVYAFHFNAEASRIGYESFDGENIHSFLPDWYIYALDSTLMSKHLSENINSK